MTTTCQTCNSTNLLFVMSHASDLHFVKEVNNPENRADGYLPSLPNIGQGDDTKITVCCDCGQLQGTWPIEMPTLIDDDDE